MNTTCVPAALVRHNPTSHVRPALPVAKYRFGRRLNSQVIAASTSTTELNQDCVALPRAAFARSTGARDFFRALWQISKRPFFAQVPSGCPMRHKMAPGSPPANLACAGAQLYNLAAKSPSHRTG